MVKKKWLSIYSVRENRQCLILLCCGVYTPNYYALLCKIPKFYTHMN